MEKKLSQIILVPENQSFLFHLLTKEATNNVSHSANIQHKFIMFAGYKTDHRAVLAFTDQCTSGGTGPYRSALVRTDQHWSVPISTGPYRSALVRIDQHWSVYTREASEIFKLSGC